MKNKIIRPTSLTKMLGISRTTLWRLEKAGKLPQKIIISDRVCGWLEIEIDLWLERHKLIHQNQQVEESNE